MGDTSDEQDLAQALDNVAGAATSLGGIPVQVHQPAPATGVTYDQPAPDAAEPTPVADSSFPMPNDTPPEPAVPSAVVGPLDSIKKDALTELRPLVDKLNVSPEEKFDTYLLLIRSTDDSNLIAPAYEAAKVITDETRRAEALLDIVKEIDYLSHPKNA